MNVLVIEASEHPRANGGIAHLESGIVECERKPALWSQHAVGTLEAVIEQRMIDLERLFLPLVAHDLIRNDSLHIAEVLLQPGVPEVGQLTVLYGRIVGRI